MATVNYGGIPVSDDEIKNVLQAIADVFKKNVNITSGDRNTALTVGAGAKSLHLQKLAADFHVEGVDDGTAYQQIKVNSFSIFANEQGYEFIWHGPYTETTGPHLHIGRYGTATIGYLKCIKEGITPKGKKVYAREMKIPITWGRDS